MCWPLLLSLGKDRIWPERIVTTLDTVRGPAPLYLSSSGIGANPRSSLYLLTI
jgi:hypothetical protein